MSDCNYSRSLEIPEELRQQLANLELLTPLERLAQANDSAVACLASILKAERAEALKLGKDVVDLYKKKAARENSANLRQLNAARRAFQEISKNDAWVKMVAKVTKVTPKIELKAIQKENRERLIEAIFESSMSGKAAVEIIAIWDEAEKILSKGGLPGLVSWLNNRITEYTELSKEPEYGRQPKSPMTASGVECMAVLTATVIALLATCSYIPFCWCCYSGWIWGEIYFKGMIACMNR